MEEQMEQPSEITDKQPDIREGQMVYSPVDVNMNDVLGTIFLGILSLILLTVFLREKSRNNVLQAQIKELGG